jgi:hypothetical protein
MRCLSRKKAKAQRPRGRDRGNNAGVVHKSCQRRKKSDGFPTGGKFPPGLDPRWEDWARPVYDFLSETRAHRDVQEWGRNNKPFIGRSLLSELLSWLENGKRVVHFRLGSVVYWRRT